MLRKAPYLEFTVASTDLISREILQQFFARFDALEDKIEKFQESQIKGVEEMRREMAGSQIKGVEEMRREIAGLRQIIRAEVLLETPSKG
jgi:hypothetical protein